MTDRITLPVDVADWSQAEIGYTLHACIVVLDGVADWSQAEIGYTDSFALAGRHLLRIGHRLRLVTLGVDASVRCAQLRIGHRLRLVTL